MDNRGALHPTTKTGFQGSRWASGIWNPGGFGVGNKNWLFILRTCPKAGPNIVRKTNQMESLGEMI